ncbi:MAG: fibronectin type III domain-containing protein [Treponema sp.]|jgi:hypothetical protein|nr:fibronectin type III domain-containing protein [Treponema sp.]
MSMRKWMLVALAMLSLAFWGCSDASGDGSDASGKGSGSENDKTYIEFQNNEAFPASVYQDVSRLTLLAEVPAKETKKVEAEPNFRGVTFYPSFSLEIEGISIVHNGQAITARVDEKKVNKIIIPALASGVIETGYAYIKVENAGDYSLTFNRGAYELSPLGAASSIVMPNEVAAYRIEPGKTDIYSFIRNASVPLAFPETVSEFERNTIYFFKDDGSDFTMNGTKPLSLPPVPAAPGKPAVTRERASITATWEAVDHADSYNVYWGENRTPPTSAGKTGVDGTSTTITGLTGGASYYVWAQAVNSRGASPLSEASSSALAPIINITYSSVSGGAWTLLDDGNRRSPAIGHGSVTKSRVSFTSTIDNASITILLDVSSQAGCDFAFISALDNASATYSSGYYNGSVISGEQSVIVTIPIPTAGGHFIDIGYRKDARSYSGSDRARFRVVE